MKQKHFILIGIAVALALCPVISPSMLPAAIVGALLGARLLDNATRTSLDLICDMELKQVDQLELALAV